MKTRSPNRGDGRILAIQVMTVAAVVLVTALIPPANGAMLILSLKGESADAIAAWSTRRDARLIGPGPIAHTLVVDGSRATLFGAALSHGGIVISASAAGCSRIPGTI